MGLVASYGRVARQRARVLEGAAAGTHRLGEVQLHVRIEIFKVEGPFFDFAQRAQQPLDTPLAPDERVDGTQLRG